MDFDDMLEEIGELGKFQVVTYALICIPVLFGAANSLTYVFTAGVPNYRCFIPECDDPIHPHYDEDWLSWVIPEDDPNSLSGYKSSQCERYKSNATFTNLTCSKDAFTHQLVKCNDWVFDDEERTIVNDWNITCFEKQWMLSLVGSSHFAGIIVGSAIAGILADRYGRKIIFVICILLMSISGVAQVFSPEYITFTILIFINAVGTSGVYPLAFIIGVELVGRKKREATGMILNYFYAVGEASVALFAWITRDWVLLQICASAPAIIFMAYYWMIPESVRWLLAKEKNEKAKGIIFKAAKINKVTLSESILDSFADDEEISRLKKKTNKPENTAMPIIKEMLKSRKLIIRFAIVFYSWAVIAFVFYGLSLNSTSISGNKYINFGLVCLVEIPGYTIAWIGIQKWGRKKPLIASLLLGGITCCVTTFVPNDVTWAFILLFLIGKFAVTSAFGIVYVHTSEMLPTLVRSGGVGAASTMARVGALLAPFVPLLGIYVQPLPMLLFGGVAIIAGLLVFKLPETLGIKLPDSVEEAIAL